MAHDDEELDPVAQFLVWLDSLGYKIINPEQRPASIVVRGRVFTSDEIFHDYHHG